MSHCTKISYAAVSIRVIGRNIAKVLSPKIDGVWLLGWKAYFGLAQTPRVWRTLDAGLRHRLGAIGLEHCKRAPTIFVESPARGVGMEVAAQVAGNARCWWRNSAMLVNSGLTISYFDRLRLPRHS